MIKRCSDKRNTAHKSFVNYLAFSVCIFILSNQCTASHTPHQTQNILFLHSYNEYLPWNVEFSKGLHDTLKKHSSPPEIYREYLDVYRLGIETKSDYWIRSLKEKYQHIKIDSVIGESVEASQFLVRYGKDIFPNAAQILLTSHEITTTENRLVIAPNFSEIVKHTVKFALEQNHSALNALIIDGGGPENLTEVQAIKDAIKHFKN